MEGLTTADVELSLCSTCTCRPTIETLGSAGLADSSRRVYQISLTTWTWLLAGEQPPARRRGARHRSCGE